MLKIEVYGDESCGPSAITYGALVLPRPTRVRLENRFSLTKIAFGARSWDEIHCNQLLNEADRAVGPWSHLGYEDIFQLLNRVCDDLIAVGSQQVVCIFDRADTASFSEAFLKPWTDAEGNERTATAPEQLAAKDKGIAVLCAGGVLRPIVDAMGSNRVTFIPDPDGNSKIPWPPRTRRVDDLMQNAFVDLRSKVTFLRVKSPKPVLLQVADIIAYTAQRAARGNDSETTVRFRSLFERMVTTTYRFVP